MPSNNHISEEDLRVQEVVAFGQDLTKSTTPESTHQIHLTKEPTYWEKLGEAQVEHLLAFIIDPQTERAMEHAEIEARVENRVIRRRHGFR